MKQNILFVSLNNDFSRQLGKEVANQLEMFFVDVDDMLQYSLVDENMLLKSGREYFDKQEKKVIRGITAFQNVLIVGNFETLSKFDYLAEICQNATLVYLKFSKQKLSKIFASVANQNQGFAFLAEDKFLQGIADVVVRPKQDDTDKDTAIKAIAKYFQKETKK